MDMIVVQTTQLYYILIIMLLIGRHVPHDFGVLKLPFSLLKGSFRACHKVLDAGLPAARWRDVDAVHLKRLRVDDAAL